MDRTFWVFHFKTYIIFAFSRMRLWRAIVFMEQSANIIIGLDWQNPNRTPKVSHVAPEKKSVPSSPKKKQGPLPNIFFLKENLLKTHEESHISAPRVMYRKVLRPCDSFIAFLFPLDLDTSNFSKGWLNGCPQLRMGAVFLTWDLQLNYGWIHPMEDEHMLHLQRKKWSEPTKPDQGELWKTQPLINLQGVRCIDIQQVDP